MKFGGWGSGKGRGACFMHCIAGGYYNVGPRKPATLQLPAFPPRRAPTDFHMRRKSKSRSAKKRAHARHEHGRAAPAATSPAAASQAATAPLSRRDTLAAGALCLLAAACFFR